MITTMIGLPASALATMFGQRNTPLNLPCSNPAQYPAPATYKKSVPMACSKAAARIASNKPVAISVWVEDPKAHGEAEAPPALFGPVAKVATVSFHKFRGPGKVTFDKERIPVDQQGAMISTTATFDTPGEYLLRVQANDESGEGGFGFQCCWTNTYVKVTVR